MNWHAKKALLATLGIGIFLWVFFSLATQTNFLFVMLKSAFQEGVGSGIALILGILIGHVFVFCLIAGMSETEHPNK